MWHDLIENQYVPSHEQKPEEIYTIVHHEDPVKHLKSMIAKPFAHTCGKRAFGQALLVPAVIWAGTKGLATSPLIRP
jgi:hypothetical protein